MHIYHCLIVDDEPIAHRILLRYLTGHERVHCCGQAYDTHEARLLCQAQTPDLLLLDIQMPEETGLDFLRSLAPRPVAILTTAHLEYALEGFELGVMDYLVKPVRRERFDLALNRAVEFLDLLHLQATLRRSELPELVEIQSGAKTVALPARAISHVQGLKDYAVIHTPERRHVVRMTIKHLEELLRPYGFVRVHKSFIVSGEKMARLHRNRIEFDGFQIPVGRRYK